MAQLTLAFYPWLAQGPQADIHICCSSLTGIDFYKVPFYGAPTSLTSTSCCFCSSFLNHKATNCNNPLFCGTVKGWENLKKQNKTKQEIPLPKSKRHSDSAHFPSHCLSPTPQCNRILTGIHSLFYLPQHCPCVEVPQSVIIVLVFHAFAEY